MADNAYLEVSREAERAQLTYGDVAELFDGVRMHQSTEPERGKRIRAEAIQVAAVALRIAEQAGRVTR